MAQTVMQKRKELIAKAIRDYFDYGIFGTIKAHKDACYERTMQLGYYDKYIQFNEEAENYEDTSKCREKFDTEWLSEAKKFKRFLHSIGYVE